MNTSTLNDILMESGLDLFSKINNVSRPSSKLSELDSKLLPSLQSNSIAEISGPSRTGKTILVLKYIIKMILPNSHSNLEIGGLALNVLLVDMELKFTIRVFIEELEHYLNQTIEKQTDDELTTCDSKQEPNQNKQDLISEIVQDSLSRLHVVYCHASSDNLNLIFQNVETRILSKQLSLDAVIIENVLNYYFEDVSVQLCSIAKYLHRILHQYVFKYMKKFNTLLIYTRYIALPRGRLPGNFISHCIQLSSVNYHGIHKCVVDLNKATYYYRIENQGLVWTEFTEEMVDKIEEEKEEVLEL